MKERPILFSGPMVRAILAGTKTQTRRLVKLPKLQPDTPREVRRFGGFWGVPNVGSGWGTNTFHPCGEPHGVVGDRLWVRESFAPRYFDNGAPAFMADWDGSAADVVPEPKWKPSIHMPRALSRISLEVTGVRVERLQDITEADIVAEGTPGMVCGRYQCERCNGRGHNTTWPSGCPDCGGTGENPRPYFAALWDSINGERTPWSSNPWVWVVSFARRTPTAGGDEGGG